MNMNTAKKLERDEKYTTTDIIIDGSGSLATSNDKKVYFTKWYSVNDNGVVVHDFTFADFTSADSEDAVETACAINGQKNNYTLECSTRYDGKNLSTNKQGREHFTAVYVDFGSRYSKEKVVYVWYPLQIEFTRPYDLAWNTDENYSKVSVDEALVATASQNDTLFSWSTSVTDSAKISFGVDNEIKIDDYKTDAPCKVPITNTFSSRSFAFTMTKSGTITPVVTRERTGEVVSARPIEFVLSTPTELYNLTSADETRDDVVNTTVAAVNEETNRLACGDKFNYGDGIPVGSISFKVYKGNSTRKKTIQNPEKTLLCECVSDGITLDVSKSNGIVTVGEDYVSIAKEDSDTFYAIEFTAEGSAYWFVDDPITKFGNTGESTKSYNVYRFEDSYVNNFASGTTQSTGEYKGAWCHDNKKVVLSHQYTTSFNNRKAANVVMNLATKTVENDHDTDSYKSTKPNDKEAILTITTSKGSIAGTDTSVTVSHDQFYGRIKTVNWKAFTDLAKEVDIVEMHEKKITLGDGAETYLQLRKLSSNEYDDTKTRTASDSYNKNTGRLQKAVLDGKNLTLVTKQSGNKEISYGVKNKVNGQTYNISVTVHDFTAKAYVVLKDNYGYQWDTSSQSSKNKDVLVSTEKTVGTVNCDVTALAGDTIAVAANTTNFTKSALDNTGNKINVNIGTGDKKGTIENYTTLKNPCAEDTSTERFTFANYVVSEDVDEKFTDGLIRFFPVSTEDKKLVETDTQATMKIKDEEISDYYKDKNQSNTCSLVVNVRPVPAMSQITGQRNAANSVVVVSYSCGLCTSTGNNGNIHVHHSNYTYANAKEPYGIAYTALGANYAPGTGKQKNAAGTYNDDGISYLNASDFGGGLSQNILSGVNGSGNVGSYMTFRRVIPYLSSAEDGILAHPTGFSSVFFKNTFNLENETEQRALVLSDFINSPVNSTYHDKYVYLKPSNMTYNGGLLFSVAYNIDGKGWKYINHGNEETTVKKLSADAYKNCLFNFSDKTTKLNFSFPEAGTGSAVEFPSKTSANPGKPRKLEVNTYKEFTNQKDISIYGGTGEDIGESWNVIRLNADALRWLDAQKVDIRITYIDTKQLNRSYTFPITFYPKKELIGVSPLEGTVTNNVDNITAGVTRTYSNDDYSAYENDKVN